MTKSKTSESGIKFGTFVLTYNRWTGYENQGVGKHFRSATEADIKGLKSGDTIWIDEDPIHPNGKVYGFVKRRVSRVQGERVYFGGGFTSLHHTIFLVNNESVLEELIAADPKMTDVIGDSGRMASRLLGLK